MKISIVGCGWLGLPLGAKLTQLGHEVLGSTTSTVKFQIIAESGIIPVLLKLDPMPTGSDFNRLFSCDLLIINIPPGRKINPPSFYEEQVKYLKYLINDYKVPRVIFVSSTSLYPNTNREVDESTTPDIQKGSSEAIVQAEKQIRQINTELIVLRCGGLMGEDRVPGKWFAGKETPGPDTPVNYVHKDDVIGVILSLIEMDKWEVDTINLVTPSHPTRKEVHEIMAKKYGFEKPKWTEPFTIPHKVVTSRLQEALNYDYQYPDPLLF